MKLVKSYNDQEIYFIKAILPLINEDTGNYALRKSPYRIIAIQQNSSLHELAF